MTKVGIPLITVFFLSKLFSVVLIDFSLSRTEQNNENIRGWEEVYLIEDKRTRKGIGGIKKD